MTLKRRVRVHPKPGQGQTFEGLLAGGRVWGSHYKLIDASVIADAEASHKLDGPVWIRHDAVQAIEGIK